MSELNTVLIVDYHSMGYADSLVASWYISMKQGPLNELYFMTHSGVPDRDFLRTLLGRVRFPKRAYAENPGNGRYLSELIQSISDQPNRILVLSKQDRKISSLVYELRNDEQEIELFHPRDWVNKETRDDVVSELSWLTNELETRVGDWYDEDDFIDWTLHLFGNEELGVDSVYDIVARLPHLVDVELGNLGGVFMRVSPRVFYV